MQVRGTIGEFDLRRLLPDSPQLMPESMPESLSELLPMGLPFLGGNEPPCAAPDAANVFTVAADDPSAVRTAKSICAGCPWIEPCAEWAISRNERWSVWGGLTYYERRKIRNERRKAALWEALHGGTR